MSYKISGTVVKGDGYGKKLGFPTVNLDVKSDIRHGVYSGIAVIGGKEYRAGIVIGPDGKTEAHLIGYNGNAYGEDVMLEIEQFLREYKKFNTEEELISQIKKDISQC